MPTVPGRIVAPLTPFAADLQVGDAGLARPIDYIIKDCRVTMVAAADRRRTTSAKRDNYPPTRPTENQREWCLPPLGCDFKLFALHLVWTKVIRAARQYLARHYLYVVAFSSHGSECRCFTSGDASGDKALSNIATRQIEMAEGAA